MSDSARAMPLYQGTKQLYADPMTRGDYNAYRGWNPPEGEDQSVPGYLVEYVDGGDPNDRRHKGYISWSPADVFERTYRQCDTFLARMLIESDDLSEKIAKLDSFMCGSDVFALLDPVDRNLLIAQRDAMVTYLTILSSRLSRTKEQA